MQRKYTFIFIALAHLTIAAVENTFEDVLYLEDRAEENAEGHGTSLTHHGIGLFNGQHVAICKANFNQGFNLRTVHLKEEHDNQRVWILWDTQKNNAATIPQQAIFYDNKQKEICHQSIDGLKSMIQPISSSPEIGRTTAHNLTTNLMSHESKSTLFSRIKEDLTRYPLLTAGTLGTLVTAATHYYIDAKNCYRKQIALGVGIATFVTTYVVIIASKG